LLACWKAEHIAVVVAKLDIGDVCDGCCQFGDNRSDREDVARAVSTPSVYKLVILSIINVSIGAN